MDYPKLLKCFNIEAQSTKALYETLKRTTPDSDELFKIIGRALYSSMARKETDAYAFNAHLKNEIKQLTQLVALFHKDGGDSDIKLTIAMEGLSKLLIVEELEAMEWEIDYSQRIPILRKLFEAGENIDEVRRDLESTIEKWLVKAVQANDVALVAGILPIRYKGVESDLSVADCRETHAFIMKVREERKNLPRINFWWLKCRGTELAACRIYRNYLMFHGDWVNAAQLEIYMRNLEWQYSKIGTVNKSYFRRDGQNKSDIPPAV
ncbi:hypothetical protein KDA11_05680 [Candidatus Saccharibacteria bacterium]|nr:hypothetical protein [Candidatus Saccharibacteria bacterium]